MKKLLYMLPLLASMVSCMEVSTETTKDAEPAQDGVFLHISEGYNDAHRADLARTGSVPIDMVVVNLYPFKETVS